MSVSGSPASASTVPSVEPLSTTISQEWRPSVRCAISRMVPASL